MASHAMLRSAGHRLRQYHPPHRSLSLGVSARIHQLAASPRRSLIAQQKPQIHAITTPPAATATPNASMSSVASPQPAETLQPLASGTKLLASSGKSYVIEAVLQQREFDNRLFCVYHATQERFEAVISLQKLLKHSPHVRTPVDSIPDRHFLGFPYLRRNLLGLQLPLAMPIVKRNLIRDALVGLADIHDKGIFHTDIKPTNIMVNIYARDDGHGGFRDVQITDLEDAVVIPPNLPGRPEI